MDKSKKYILSSIILFVISLTQTAFTTYDSNGTKTHSSLELFLGGGFAFLGGGFMETIVWMANPFYLFSLIGFYKSEKSVKIFSSISFVLAFSFLGWREVLGNEGGHMTTISSHNIGFWLWIFSIVVLNLGIFSKKK